MAGFWEWLAEGVWLGMKLDTFSGLLRMTEGPAAEAEFVAVLLKLARKAERPMFGGFRAFSEIV
jgi:hypothetical protein